MIQKTQARIFPTQQSAAPPAKQGKVAKGAAVEQDLYLVLKRAEWVSAALTLAYVIISVLAFFAIKKQAYLTEKQEESSGEQLAKSEEPLTNGGLRAGVRSLPDAERLIANLKNEIRLDKFVQLCK